MGRDGLIRYSLRGTLIAESLGGVWVSVCLVGLCCESPWV